MTFRDIIKQDYDRAKFRRYCKCGHSIIFPPTSKTNIKICGFCGKAIYKNDKIEFKKNLEKLLKI